MAVGDEDVTVRGDDDIGGLIEEIRTGPRHASLAERHQDLARWTELEHLMPFAGRAAGVGHPEVAVAIDGRAVREHEHVLAERREQLSVLVVFEDWRLAAPGARVLEAAGDDVNRSVRR